MTELRKPIDYPFLGKNYKSYTDLGRAFANNFESAKREIFTRKFLNYIKSADLFLYGEIKQEIMRCKFANNAISTVIYKLNPKLGIILFDMQIKNFTEFIVSCKSPDPKTRKLLLDFLEDHCLSHIFKALEKDDSKTDAFWNMIVEVENQAKDHDYVLSYLVYVWNYRRNILNSDSFKELDTYVSILEEGKGTLFTEFNKLKTDTSFLGYVAYEYGFVISNTFDQDTFMSLFDFLNFASKNVKFVFDNFFSKSPILWLLANYKEYEFKGEPAELLKEDIIEFNNKLAVSESLVELDDLDVDLFSKLLKEANDAKANDPFSLEEDIALEDEDEKDLKTSNQVDEKNLDDESTIENSNEEKLEDPNIKDNEGQIEKISDEFTEDSSESVEDDLNEEKKPTVDEEFTDKEESSDVVETKIDDDKSELSENITEDINVSNENETADNLDVEVPDETETFITEDKVDPKELAKQAKLDKKKQLMEEKEHINNVKIAAKQAKIDQKNEEKASLAKEKEMKEQAKKDAKQALIDQKNSQKNEEKMKKEAAEEAKKLAKEAVEEDKAIKDEVKRVSKQAKIDQKLKDKEEKASLLQAKKEEKLKNKTAKNEELEKSLSEVLSLENSNSEEVINEQSTKDETLVDSELEDVNPEELNINEEDLKENVISEEEVVLDNALENDNDVELEIKEVDTNSEVVEEEINEVKLENSTTINEDLNVEEPVNEDDDNSISDELINRKENNEKTIDFESLKEDLALETKSELQVKEQEAEADKRARTRTITSVEILANDFGEEVEIFNEALDIYERFQMEFIYSNSVKSLIGIYAKERSGNYDPTIPFDKYFLVTKQFLIEEGLVTDAPEISEAEKASINKRNRLALLDNTKDLLLKSNNDLKIAVDEYNDLNNNIYDKVELKNPNRRSRSITNASILFGISLLAILLHVFYVFGNYSDKLGNFFYQISLGNLDNSSYLVFRGSGYSDILVFVTNLLLILGVLFFFAALVVALFTNRRKKNLTVESVLNKEMGRNHQSTDFILTRVENVRSELELKVFEADTLNELPDDYDSVINTIYTRKDISTTTKNNLMEQIAQSNIKVGKSHTVITSILFAIGTMFITYILTAIVAKFSNPVGNSFIEECRTYIVEINETGQWLYLGLASYIIVKVLKRKENAVSVLLFTLISILVLVVFVLIEALVR